LRNADPVFKILHRPSLRAFLIDEEPYLDYEPDHQAPVTLAYAVYYVAVCTIDDPQCQVMFGLDKKTVSAELQRETEAALIKSDFVTTNDLTILQAYVLSLVSSNIDSIPSYVPSKLINSRLPPDLKTKADACGPCWLWDSESVRHYVSISPIRRFMSVRSTGKCVADFGRPLVFSI
jgi:hypothetical protein